MRNDVEVIYSNGDVLEIEVDSFNMNENGKYLSMIDKERNLVIIPLVNVLSITKGTKNEK